jgi:hypothetical protein
MATSTALDVGRIDFLTALRPPEGVEGWREKSAAYLYRCFTCEVDTRLPVQMGSDDGMQLWLNGERLIDKPVPRGLNLGDEQLELALRAGRNHLLVKVVQDGGAWAFQMAPWTRCSQEAVDQAIDRGVEYLLDRQLIDGSWPGHPEYGQGETAYCVYTLLKCGLPPGHPAVQRGLAFVRARPTGYTYSLSCEVLALCAMGPAADPVWRERKVRELIGIQESSGLYAYPVHPNGSIAHDDLSNTLYAALALRAAAEAGLEVPGRVWRRLLDGTFRCYDPEGDRAWRYEREEASAGFRYTPGGGGTTGSMTTAGLSVMAIVDQQLEGRHSKSDKSRIESSTKTSLNWLERNMTWAANPGQGGGHHYFFIYGMERVGVLLGLTILGGVDWYWSGADYLVRNQKESGAWVNEDGSIETILALLFLKRATMASTGKSAQSRTRHYAVEDPEADVLLHASGDTPMSIWVERLRPELAKELEWSGQSGRGPHIERVEFLARPVAEGAAWEVVGVDEGDGTQPAGLRRFATQQRFPENGAYLIKARVHVRAPAQDGGLPQPRTLESPELRVRVDGVLRPEALDYATDRQRDLLADAFDRAGASSSAGGHEPAKCADGRMGTSWKCAPDDASPWIELELRRATRASRVLLTVADPRPGRSDAPRPASVEVRINGKDAYVLPIDPDVSRKSVLELEKPERIRSLRVTILESRGRNVGGDPVGFAEVELQETR